MSRYRKIDPRIWNDAKFRALSNNGKLIFFMLLTHPNMTALGAMRATLSGLAEELDWPSEAFREAFAEVLQKGMAEHDQKACLIALPKFLRYNPPESPNVIKAWASALDLLPECDLKTRVIAGARAFAEGMTEGFAKALPEAFAKSMPNQEQEQEQEQENNGADAPSLSTMFSELWLAWPTGFGEKGSRKTAEAAFRKIKPDAALFVTMLRAIEAQTLDKITKSTAKQFVAPFQHVERWLKNRRWEDEITTVTAGHAPPINLTEKLQDRSWAEGMQA